MKYFVVRTIGVMAICGCLQVASADDQTIATSLATELKQAQQTSALNDFKIGVRVENGVVWMTGRVASPGQRDEALAIARAINDVKLVVNDITVGDAVTETEPAEGVSNAGAHTAENTAKVAGPKVLSESRRQELESQAAEPQAPATETSSGNQPVGFFTESTGGVSPQRGRVTETANTYMPRADLRTASEFSPPPMSSPPAVRGNLGPDQVAVRPMNRRMAARPRPMRTTRPVPMQRSQVRPVQYCGEGGCAAGNEGGYSSEYAGPSYESGGYSSGGPVVEMGGYSGGGNSGGYGGQGGIGYENASMPDYAWPSYAAHPNYAAVTYPKQYSPNAWPYIGPFYPYPQVPLGWRKVTLEWDDGWWMLDFNSK